MILSKTRIALVRTGSACKHAEDPEHARIWLAERYHLSADYHPDTQAWLSAEQRAQIILNYKDFRKLLEYNLFKLKY